MGGEENQTGEAQSYDQFPSKAMWIYISVIVFSAVIGLVTEGVEMAPENGVVMAALIIFVSLLLGSMGVFAFTMIQYMLIKVPSQWIARTKEVYKYDILAALFYSNAIGMLLSVFTNQIGYGQDVLVAALNAVVITVLFLYFYFYGTNKPKHVKRAVITVQMLWLALSLVFSVVAYRLL